MANQKMSEVPNPIIVDAAGTAGSGYVLKAYDVGTTDSKSITIDADATSPQTSVTANSNGVWEVSGNEIVPHINGVYKWGIFANATDATANTPFYMGPFDSIQGSASTNNWFFAENYSTFALAVAAAAGKTLFISSVIAPGATETVAGLTIVILEAGAINPTTGITITLNCTVHNWSQSQTVFGGAGTIAGWHNLVLGPEAGAALTTPVFAGHNTMIGAYAGQNTTTSRDNTFIGYECGKAHIADASSFGGNTAVGANCFDVNTTGYQNTAIGNTALDDNVTGNFNTAVGYGALQKNLLSNNTAVGIQALYLGNNNDDATGIGMFALANCTATTTKNTAIGFSAALNFGKASDGYLGGDTNLFCGAQAGLASREGNRNTFVGGASATHGATTDMTGDDNTFVGAVSGDLNIVDGDKSTILGAYSDVPILITGQTTSTTTDKLVDSTEHFTTNAYVGLTVKNLSDTEVTGNHDGSSGASVLTDSGESWGVNDFLGRIIYNTTDGSSGTVTANTGTTITATLTGGTENDWDASDSYTLRVGRTTVSAVDSATTLSLNHNIMITGENYEMFDESSTVSLCAGGSSNAPKPRFYSPSDGSATIGKLGSSGRLYKNLSESVTTPGAASSFIIQVNIPSGAKIIGCQLKVDTALGSGETWSAAYSGGSTQSIVTTGQVITAGHIVDTFFDVNAATDIASAEVDVTITRDSGNFTSTGAIRAIVHYEAFQSMS
ncbi:MAG: hypothetical protein JKY22_12150 [Flavobacteriaceae bacterium]|nr:hypothetical protein [Flavobacteriaceae bacterium]PCJ26500.1 MAG: hypothetical protein COA94_05165 [Rickettsiales bacterium]